MATSEIIAGQNSTLSINGYGAPKQGSNCDVSSLFHITDSWGTIAALVNLATAIILADAITLQNMRLPNISWTASSAYVSVEQ